MINPALKCYAPRINLADLSIVCASACQIARKEARIHTEYVHEVCQFVGKKERAHTGYVHIVCQVARKEARIHTEYVYTVCQITRKEERAHTEYVHAVCRIVKMEECAHTQYECEKSMCLYTSCNWTTHHSMSSKKDRLIACHFDWCP